MNSASLRLDFRSLTPATWDDFTALFGERGACGGCWCMWWRLTHAEFERNKGDGNRSAMQAIVQSGEVPGILAYCQAEPIGWCAVAPRERFARLARSRILRPVDDRPVWSVVCFFIRKDFRRRGVSIALLRAALDHVRRCGGDVVEGYPVEPKDGRLPDAFVWPGPAATFRAAGFTEVARRSPTRPIMRFYLTP
ncbi:MAG: GNAT family N-acetyltransferase [Acidobacteria bacterium]|nr:GNAT family N-acetyltransferase [Acidobacteriota bacterium]